MVLGLFGGFRVPRGWFGGLVSKVVFYPPPLTHTPQEMLVCTLARETFKKGDLVEVRHGPYARGHKTNA